ncbi:malto-oligosyltrehalose trehalohydrolase [Cutibacterium sp. WCA-380-WT-3A]|uniref:Malto-oligosyltrehalose trehalohydrolase n=1 Tax=Cutibacterium porci TaxID=2605781 RepID=A0A7K0J4M1_9ACTN|nr:malto-oligosyltrehalose trehalohydrolase [Cutibacterium porci]MSS44863.1 malto-oligosyltrehalose trehalohydrolase [Cutibacterium porci]
MTNQLTVWAPTPTKVQTLLDGHLLDMTSNGEWWTLPQPVKDGQRYQFILDGCGPFPDPRSRYQPEGVHGPSQVYTPHQPAPWHGMDLKGQVLYEMHIGTFTEQGTFTAAIDHLDDLVELGVKAVEVMPVAQIPGTRGWGYDGVDLYATQNTYGGPAAFQQFIDAAHFKGLGVILDVVYNHLGSEGNYLANFGPYFNHCHATPWGDAVNFDGDDNSPVRQFVIDNAYQWLVKYGVDGLRLDAVHALVDDSDTHILAELSAKVAEWSRQISRPLTLIAESDLNQPDMVTPVGVTEKARGMTMQWDDDIHHALHAFFTGETAGYYSDFGSAETLVKAFTKVFVHDGGWSSFREQNWGAPVDIHSSHYDAASFVSFIQDHDQVGNRAAGDRLGHNGADPNLQAASAALYLLGPFTPMVFMGEEWAASTPFPFFSDLGPNLGPSVTAGRRQEFQKMGWQSAIPDPQAMKTFRLAQLKWAERNEPEHAKILNWYRDLLRIRASLPTQNAHSLETTTMEAISPDAIVMKRPGVAVVASRSDVPVTIPGLADNPSRVLARGNHRFENGSVTLTGPGCVVVIN